MEKLNKELTCVKCGFKPTHTNKWNLEFKNDCTNFGFNKCDWDDTDTKEHLHQECPDCGYKINVPCEDNEAVISNTWNTTTQPVKPDPNYPNGGMGVMKGQGQKPATKPVTNTPVLAAGRVVTPIHKAKPAKCASCTHEKVGTAEAK